MPAQQPDENLEARVPHDPELARTNNVDDCVDAAIQRVGKYIVLALPLGLGKANHVANAFYKRACTDSSISLHILTALTLEVPAASGTLGQRFLQPIKEQLYAGVPELLYACARRNNQLPANVRVSEFFFSPGKLLGMRGAQQNYISSNYTHIVRDLVSHGVNVLAQMLAPHPNNNARGSLSCNTDLTLDLFDAAVKAGKPLYRIGEINAQLPFLANDAEVNLNIFDCVLDGREKTDSKSSFSPGNYPLFCVPNQAVDLVDYAIALHVSSMVKDGGTLQIGIGSLGDAIAHTITLRHLNNAPYHELIKQLISPALEQLRAALPLEIQPFTTGLYGCSEMLIEGLIHLRQAGVLKRHVAHDIRLQRLLNTGQTDSRVDSETLRLLVEQGVISNPLIADDIEFLRAMGIIDPDVQWDNGVIRLPSGQTLNARIDQPEDVHVLRGALAKNANWGTCCHGGFYLGSAALYDNLRQLNDAERQGINMTRISFINSLHGDESLKRAQRLHARFVNSAMMVALTGEAVSDGIADHQVVSGVGGQYNFVTQGHELENGRSIICLPSTRWSKGKLHSNIIWEYPHTTIPRHLRDIVVTEYGAADLRGKSDRDVIVSMLAITDSRFQTPLLEVAKKAGKVERDYAIPEAFQNNLPEKLTAVFYQTSFAQLLPYYPFGSSFSPIESQLAVALQYLKTHDNKKYQLELLKTGWQQLKRNQQSYAALLERLDLLATKTLKEKLYQLLVVGALYTAINPQRPLLGSTPKNIGGSPRP